MTTVNYNKVIRVHNTLNTIFNMNVDPSIIKDFMEDNYCDFCDETVAGIIYSWLKK